jgi:peptidoglycan hydrolase-like protein with peptidoglycan-binding domain
VQRVQQALANQGYSLDVDGIYGRGTAHAVMQFQRANGLTADGVVGPRTLAALQPYMS